MEVFSQARTFNLTTNLSTGNFAVLNKTHVANAVGIVMTSAFVLGTLLYNLPEEQSAQSRFDNLLSTFTEKPKKEMRGNSCDSYCENYYYYRKKR